MAEIFRTGSRITDLIEARRKQVQVQLLDVTASDLRGSNVEDVVARLLGVGVIRVPRLRRDLETMRPVETFLAEQKRPNSWDSRDGSGPPPVTAYRFVLQIPFEGDGHVFNYPHTPAVRALPAAAEQNILYVKHETVEVDQESIRAQLNSHCVAIEAVLDVLRQVVEPWNIECEQWIRKDLDERVEALAAADQVATALTGSTPVRADGPSAGCADIAKLMEPLTPGLAEDVRRRLVAGLERGVMRIRDDSESALEDLRVEMAKKGQVGSGVADGRLQRFHVNVMERGLQHIWTGLLDLRTKFDADPSVAEQALAQTMACYVDQVLTPLVQLVQSDRAGTGRWSGERTVRVTAQLWKARFSADARGAMVQVVAEREAARRARTTRPATGPGSLEVAALTPAEASHSAGNLEGNGPELGRGGFGVVRRHDDPLLKMPFAFKTVSPYFPDPDGLEHGHERFYMEARILMRLSHPNIVRVHSVLQLPDGRAQIRMELIAGRTLVEIHRRGISAAAAARVVRDLASALAYAHRATPPVVHRDIKPSNVMVEDGTARVVLLDFGLGVFVEAEITRVTRAGERPAGGRYTAPELEGNPGLVDPRTDIYSLGAVWFFLLFGRAPVGSEVSDQIQRHEGLAPTQQALLSRCLGGPEGRPTAAEVNRLLAELDAHSTPPAAAG